MSFVKQLDAGKKLRVIGVGLMGTGTTSLKLALDELLMEPCYHSGHAAIESSTQKWLDIFDNNGDGIQEILSGYAATVGYPACWLDCELLPGSLMGFEARLRSPCK